MCHLGDEDLITSSEYQNTILIVTFLKIKSWRYIDYRASVAVLETVSNQPGY